MIANPLERAASDSGFRPKTQEPWVAGGIRCSLCWESSSAVALSYNTAMLMKDTSFSRRLLGNQLRQVHFLHKHIPWSFMSLCNNIFFIYYKEKFNIVIWWGKTLVFSPFSESHCEENTGRWCLFSESVSQTDKNSRRDNIWGSFCQTFFNDYSCMFLTRVKISIFFLKLNSIQLTCISGWLGIRNISQGVNIQAKNIINIK